MKRLIFVVFGLLLLWGCSHSSRNKKSSKVDDSLHQKKQKMKTRTYRNSSYSISLAMPESWALVEKPNLQAGDFAINVFPKDSKAAMPAPLSVHGAPQYSYVAIWPRGMETALPKGGSVPLDEAKAMPNLSFVIDKHKSKALQLKDNSTWAYFIAPKNPPKSWTKNGFIFAQIGLSDESMRCYDDTSGKQIPVDQCDKTKNTRMVRTGKPNAKTAKLIDHILRSISLKK